ncbi:G-protein coupled receptor 35-like [Engraulis encrasicolus]|uniref:G-protein coupled receptor 35-like n=1 Tax=Engraulis encrasicolus TaxID=184585 RepID=UPI002FD29BDC
MNLSGDQMCNETGKLEAQTFQQVAYIPVFVLGLVLNAMAVCTFIRRRRQWTDSHIYMLNLALADCTLVLFLPVRVYDAYHPIQPSLLCTVMISIHYVNMYASILTVTCISVHRYLSIRFPFWAQQHTRARKRLAASVCTFIWVTIVAICLAFHSENLPENLCTCYSRSEKPLSIQFLLALETVGYFLPLLIMSFCCIQICCILQDRPGEISEPGGAGETSEQKLIFIRLVRANLIVFVFCYTPIHLAFFLVEYHKAHKTSLSSMHKHIHEFREVSEWITTTNCCLDSFGYYFLLTLMLEEAGVCSCFHNIGSMELSKMFL